MAKTQLTHSNRLSYKRLLGMGAALVAFFILLSSVIGLAEKYFAIKDRTRELKKQQAALIHKEQTLMEQNAYLETPEGKAQVLRAKFNVVQPGEEMIIISGIPETVPEQAEGSGVLSWWDSILQGLGIRE